MIMSKGPAAPVKPCAACKLLRRRCAQECPFLPYFPAHEPQRFASVHKIFGASNVSKMLMEVQESQRGDVANSLVYEASARLRDPVHGCLGAISALQQQAQSLQAELNAVRAEIMRYRFHESAVAATAAATVSTTLGFPTTPDRGTSSGLPSQISSSTDFVIASNNSVPTSDVKERYWSSLT
ncbi:hypothetical protein O6H91_01G040400 [Diphasiastrum complanatum]|uniref:Uncharacterized protein n=1 Tax=Diphasiastrum complanatum TaxID=34168 RepID=A0ACC2EQ40_DIPCM|nr:hypothetical protein O6H91_01G040400 [Diphasiastrum complanatum]